RPAAIPARKVAIGAAGRTYACAASDARERTAATSTPTSTPSAVPRSRAKLSNSLVTVQIFPRVDVVQRVRGHGDLGQVQWFQQTVDGEIGQRLLLGNGGAHRVSAGDEQQVLSTAVSIDGDDSVSAEIGEEQRGHGLGC